MVFFCVLWIIHCKRVRLQFFSISRRWNKLNGLLSVVLRKKYRFHWHNFIFYFFLVEESRKVVLFYSVLLRWHSNPLKMVLKMIWPCEKYWYLSSPFMTVVLKHISHTTYRLLSCCSGLGFFVTQTDNPPLLGSEICMNSQIKVWINITSFYISLLIRPSKSPLIGI